MIPRPLGGTGIFQHALVTPGNFALCACLFPVDAHYGPASPRSFGHLLSLLPLENLAICGDTDVEDTDFGHRKSSLR